jgi:hypothetical protein
VHHQSDQDVLNALLGSKECQSIAVQQLQVGRDVIHCGGALGYSLGRRLGGLCRRVPPFLHAIAGKPWWVLSPEYRRSHAAWFTYYRRLLQETSPYVAAARSYRDEVGLPCPWLDAWSPPGLCLRAAGLGHFALRGLPLTLAVTIGQYAGRVVSALAASSLQKPSAVGQRHVVNA